MAKGKIVQSWTMKSTSVTGGHRGMSQKSAYNCDYDQKHQNHNKGKCDSVFKVFGNPEAVVAKAAMGCEAVNLSNTMKGKGGRPIDSFARQFEFSFPKGQEPKNLEEWKVLARDALTLIAKRLDVSKEDLAKHSFATVHMNKSNPHMDLIVSKSINGKIHSKINSLHLSNSLRVMTNKTMLKLGIDYAKYEPLGTGRKKKWQYEQKQAKEAEQKALEASKQANIDTLKANQANEELNLTKADLKTLKRFNTNYGKELKIWFESQDEKAALKSENKLQKMHNKIKKRFSDKVLNKLGHYGATEEAEKKKKRKIGLRM